MMPSNIAAGLRLAVSLAAIFASCCALEDRPQTKNGSLRRRGLEQADDENLTSLILEMMKSIEDLSTEVESLKKERVELEERVSLIEIQQVLLEEKSRHLQQNPLSSCIAEDNPENGIIVISGCNLIVNNGLNETETTNGLGNIIIGYGVTNTTLYDVGGSHNLALGVDHEYSSYGGIVAGMDNSITAPFASVLGGVNNEASFAGTTVLGGQGNTASGYTAVVSGGANGEASGLASVVAAGTSNTASGSGSSVVGGQGNSAEAAGSSVSGGAANKATKNFASVTGGRFNNARGFASVITGGNEIKTKIFQPFDQVYPLPPAQPTCLPSCDEPEAR